MAEAASLGVEFVRAATMPSVVEDSGTFIGNARKKVAALKAILPPEAWVLADDSGLCVDALGGDPGVESAYFAGPQGDAAANLSKLIRVMRDVPAGKRGAYFVCVLVLQGGREGLEQIFEGRCVGTLRGEPAGGTGFGYDPLFEPGGHTQTYAELGETVKNAISHRASAFAQLASRLRPDT